MPIFAIQNLILFNENLDFFQVYNLKKLVLSVFSQENSPLFPGFLPKWPYAEVISYMGLFKPNNSLIPLGDKLKFWSIIFLTLLTLFSSPSASFIKIDNGLETPIA